jgi:hypothetical protein
MTDPTKLTFDSAVEIEGREDTPQLTVQGHTTQDQPLQTWEDHSGAEVAHMNGDGSLDLAEQSSAPDTPPSGMVRLFADQTDGHLKQKDDQGDVVDLAQAGGGGSLPGSTYLRTLLYDETLASDGTFDITDISQDYDHLEFILLCRSDYTAGNYDAVYMYHNGDTTSTNYRNARVPVYDSTYRGNEGDSAVVGDVPASYAGSSAYAGAITHGHLYFYTNTSFWKHCMTESSYIETGTSAIGAWTHRAWESNSAINRITITPVNGTSFVAGSRLQIFGLKAYSAP